MPQNVIDAILIACFIAFVLLYLFAYEEMRKLTKQRDFDHHVNTAMKIANRK